MSRSHDRARKVADINEHRERKFMLPYFKIREVVITVDDVDNRSVGTALEVTCQRTGCKKKFIISRRWIRRQKYGTSPCPHCFAVSIIPGGNYKGP